MVCAVVCSHATCSPLQLGCRGADVRHGIPSAEGGTREKRAGERNDRSLASPVFPLFQASPHTRHNSTSPICNGLRKIAPTLLEMTCHFGPILHTFSRLRFAKGVF